MECPHCGWKMPAELEGGLNRVAIPEFTPVVCVTCGGVSAMMNQIAKPLYMRKLTEEEYGMLKQAPIWPAIEQGIRFASRKKAQAVAARN